MTLEIDPHDMNATQAAIYKAIREWQSELLDDSIIDEIIYETLDSVIDVVMEVG